MGECVFCRIIRGGTPCARIYEDEHVISFLDINPINTGHALIIPKTHCETLFDVPEIELKACAVAAKRIGSAVFRAVDAAGLNFLQNNLRPAGQLIFHVHFHLIPRFPRDNFLTTWPARPAYPGELEAVLEKVKTELGRG